MLGAFLLHLIYFVHLEIILNYIFFSKSKNRSGRTTALQFEELVKYMETHSEFASNKFLTKEGRVHHNQQWAELAQMLNELTKGPGKTVKQWQTVIIHTH